MTVGVIVVVLLATLAAFVLAAGVLGSERARRREIYRLSDGGQDGSALGRLSSRVETRLMRTSSGRRLRISLDNADIHTRIGTTALTVSAVSAFLLLVAWRTGGPIFVLIVAVLGFVGARVFLRSRADRRRRKFIEQLPELSRLLGNATNAGLSLRASLSVAAQESQEPMRSELQAINEELALGSSMDDTLERMARRLPSRELAVLLNVLIIQIRAGGRIVTALRGITVALEARRDVRREVDTLLAGSKATVLAVAGLGALMVFLVHTATEDGLRGLLENPAGLILFVICFTVFVFGLWLVRGFTRVEV